MSDVNKGSDVRENTTGPGGDTDSENYEAEGGDMKHNDCNDENDKHDETNADSTEREDIELEEIGNAMVDEHRLGKDRIEKKVDKVKDNGETPPTPPFETDTYDKLVKSGGRDNNKNGGGQEGGSRVRETIARKSV